MATNSTFLSDWNDVVYEGRNELVFEHKNKEYGAYEIRSRYNKNVMIAVISSVLFMVLCLSIPIISSWIRSLAPDDIKEATEVEVNLAEPPPIDETEPPPPPVEPPPPLLETIKFTPPVVVPDEEVDPEEIPPTQESVDSTNVGTVTQEGDANLDVLPSEGDATIGEGPPEIFVSVEEMPGFPGGEAALFAYLGKNIQYPMVEKEAGISGTVYVYFVINKQGKVQDAKIARGVKGGAGLDKEALRVIQAMPDWSVGKQNGRPAMVQFTLPVKFVLR